MSDKRSAGRIARAERARMWLQAKANEIPFTQLEIVLSDDGHFWTVLRPNDSVPVFKSLDALEVRCFLDGVAYARKQS